MDKETVDKVTKLVVEVLREMQAKGAGTDKSTVKIWHHQTPLPEPIVISGTTENNEANHKQIITFSPYK